MRPSVLGLCLTASLGLAATGAAQTTDPMAGHAGMPGMPGMSGMQGMPMADAVGTAALLTGPLGTRSPTGTVTVEGRTVRVAWSGDQPGSTRPWYVHKGACGRDQGVVGAPNAYRPIAVDARGTGSGTATLPEPLTASGAYYVAVHSGVAGSPSDIVACGALGSGGMSSGQMAGMPGRSASGGQSAGQGMAGMAGMDHSMMNMPGMSPARGGGSMPMGPSMMRGASGAAGSAGMSSRAMMADHLQLMADHMQMMADHLRMMAQMPAEDGAMAMPMQGDPPRRSGTSRGRTAQPSASKARARTSGAGGGMNMPGMSMPGMAMPGPRPAATPRDSSTKQPPARKSAPPAAKKDSMPGMDHSKMPMPGMGKP